MKHKHCDLIKAWADGATIQFKYENGDGSGPEWETFKPGEAPSWLPECEYRIKPKTIKYRLYLWQDRQGSTFVVSVNTLESPEQSKFFVRWLGDWQEVEV